VAAAALPAMMKVTDSEAMKQTNGDEGG